MSCARGVRRGSRARRLSITVRGRSIAAAPRTVECGLLSAFHSFLRTKLSVGRSVAVVIVIALFSSPPQSSLSLVAIDHVTRARARLLRRAFIKV